MQVIQRIVSHTERALKFVSDALADQSLRNSAARNSHTSTKPAAAAAAAANKSIPTTTEPPKINADNNKSTVDKEPDSKKDGDKKDSKEDGRDNQLYVLSLLNMHFIS